MMTPQSWRSSPSCYLEEGKKAMRKTVIGAALAGLLIVPATAAQRCDRGLGKFRDGPFWFPGTVESQTGDAVRVIYDDDMAETLPASLVTAFNLTAGTRVECRYRGGRRWYRGRITRITD